MPQQADQLPRPELPGSDLIRIGVVGKPHGVAGSFYIEGAVDALALAAGLTLSIADREWQVVSRAGTDLRPIVKLAELIDRDAAAALRGQQIFAQRVALTPLAEGEWYASDLEGMTVVRSDGGKLGSVRQLKNTPSVDVLEVELTVGPGELLVPMVSDAIKQIDADTRTVVVDAEFLALDDDGRD